MRFATFNIHHGVPPGATAVDHDLLARTVLGLGADVVGLQEVDRRTSRVGGVDQPELLAAATGMSAHFGRAIPLRGGGYGNLLLTTAELVEVHDLALPARGEDRVAVLARLRGDDGEWCVAVTHLQQHRRGHADEAPGQLGVVLGALDELAGPDRPAVLLGDLNLGADRVLPALAARGYLAAPASPTFPSHRPRSVIDWIAARRATVTAVEVPDVRVSDHRPLVADLRAEHHMDGPAGRPYPAR